MQESSSYKNPRRHGLDEIGLQELAIGCFRHPAVMVLLPLGAFLALTVGSGGGAGRLVGVGGAVPGTVAFCALAWYALHRLLHGSSAYRGAMIERHPWVARLSVAEALAGKSG